MQLALGHGDLHLRRRRRAPGAGVVTRSVSDRRGGRRPGPRGGGRRPRRRPGRRRRCRSSQPYEHDDDWGADAGRARASSVFERLRAGARRRVRRWSAADRLLFGFAEHQMTSTTSSAVHRPAAPLRPARRPPRAQRQVRRPRPLGVGRRCTPATSPTSTSTALDRPRSTSGWTGPRTRIDLPAGRYETLLPPTAVADLMIYAYWTGLGPRRRGGPQRLRRRPTAAPGSASSSPPLPLTLRSDPAAPGPASARRSRSRPRPTRGLQSVFDNGAPVGADDLDRRRHAHRPGPHPRVGRSAPAAAPRPFVDNLILDGGAGGARRSRR